jgi:hypothetical protein
MKERITRIVNGLPEGTRQPRKASKAYRAESAERAKSDGGGQENLPHDISNIFGWDFRPSD